MSINIHSNFYEDNYLRNECQGCKKTFIVGETLSENIALTCPYCKSTNVEATACTSDETLEDVEMGCAGIYYHIYDDDSFMLYTEKELMQALKEHFASSHEKTMPLGGHNKIMMEFCLKRDNKS